MGKNQKQIKKPTKKEPNKNNKRQKETKITLKTKSDE